MGKARVSFVILHYKEAEVTDSCVRSILKMDGQEQIRIIIVDNDIHEDPQKRKGLAERYEKFPCITVLPIFENGGFSYANNQGYAYAREKEQADFVVVLNNDIEFLQKDFIRRLEESYEKNPCAVLGPDIIKKSTKEHQNPLDWRTRTREEADATIRKNKAISGFLPGALLELSKNGPDADKTADKAGDDLPDSQKRNCAVRGLPDFYP